MFDRRKYKYIDIYGRDLEFNFTKEKKKFQTNCGASLTVLFFILGVSGFAIFFLNYLKTTDPRVTKSIEKTNVYPEIDLLRNDFIPVFSLFDQSGLIPYSKIPKYSTMIISKFIFDKENTNSDLVKMKLISKQTIVDCRDSKIDDKTLEHLLRNERLEPFYNLGSLLCPENLIDRDFWRVNGTGNQIPFETISFSFYPCSLPSESDCASEQELSRVVGRLSSLSRSYTLSRKESPIDLIFVPDRLPFGLNPSSVQKYDVDFRRVVIIDESYDFSKPRTNEEFFAIDDKTYISGGRTGRVHCSKEEIDTRTCRPYDIITLKSGSHVETVLRLYPKLISMASKIGGFGNMVFVALGIFYFCCNSKMYNSWIKKLILRPEDKKTCRMILEENERLVEDDEFDRIADEYYSEKMSGVDIIRNSNFAEALSVSLISVDHAKVLSLMPLFDKFGDKLKRKKELIQERDPKESLKAVLSREPQNEIERMIKEHVEGGLGFSKNGIRVGRKKDCNLNTEDVPLSLKQDDRAFGFRSGLSTKGIIVSRGSLARKLGGKDKKRRKSRKRGIKGRVRIHSPIINH